MTCQLSYDTIIRRSLNRPTSIYGMMVSVLDLSPVVASRMLQTAARHILEMKCRQCRLVSIGRTVERRGEVDDVCAAAVRAILTTR